MENNDQPEQNLNPTLPVSPVKQTPPVQTVPPLIVSKPKVSLMAIIGIILLVMIVIVTVSFYMFKPTTKKTTISNPTKVTVSSLKFDKNNVYQGIKIKLIQILK